MPVKVFQKRNHAVLGVFLVLAIGVFMPWQMPIYAQVVGATLSGTVTDASGATVPNAQVSVRNTGTDVTRVVMVDSAGFYTVPNLLPGDYEVRFSAQGFRTAVNNSVTLTVGAQQVLNATLRVGQMSQQVVVTSEAPTVELASSSLDAVVEAPTILALPLNGRSWTDLANLQPGVSAIETQMPFGIGGRGNRGYGAQLSISGSRPQQNNYRLDGISINDYANGGPGSILGGNLGVDAIAEFSVLTSNYSAEYGKTSGGVVNAISRSGTNQFHGSAYWFLRDEGLDARNFFDTVRPSFHRNQFGASAGGPIRKDRTFVFGDYEGIHQAKGVSRLDKVPSLAARNGLLCSLCPIPQQLTPDPNDPNGTDPNGVDLNIKKFLGLYPLPNGPSFGNGDVAPFNFTGQRVVTENYFTIRLDHHFSNKDSIFGTYMFDRTPFTTDEPFGNIVLGFLTKRQIVALEETHAFSPTLVNTVRVGYNRDRVDNNTTLSAPNPLAADHSLATVPGQYAPGCTCPGLTFLDGGLGGASIFLYRWNAYQAYDDAFLTKGLHSIKFGFGFERDEDNQTTITEQTGTFGFGSMKEFLTNHPKRLVAVLPGLLTERGMRDSIVGAYVQDDWRFRPNLTLNLGLRYEMSTVPTEVQGKLSNLYNITDIALLGTPPMLAAAPHCGRPDPGCVGTGPYFYNATLRNFAPRVGFAWDPFRNGKTAVRAGFGLFDSLPLLYQLITLNGRAAPFFAIGSATSLPAYSFPAVAFNSLGSGSLEYGAVERKPHRNYVMQWSLNVQRELAPDLTAMVGYVGSHGVHQPFRVDNGDEVIPRLTSAGYLWPNPNCNNPNPSPLCVTINPYAGSIRILNWAGSSSYDALQVGVQKRMSHGLQVQGSFTWGKSIDNNSGVVAGDTFSNAISSLDWFDLRLTRALSDFQIGRTLVINGTWMVPAPKSAPGALAWAIKGWELTAVFKANDGVPFSALFGTGGDPRGTLNSTDDYAFPNRTQGCNPIDLNFRQSPTGQPVYIKHDSQGNPACFAVPTAPCPTGTTASTCPFYNGSASNGIGCDPTPFADSAGNPVAVPFPQCFNLRGNSGRNTLIGPGLTNLDFSIVKNTHVRRISENFNVEFRAEFFNILNHANFNVPDLANGDDDAFDATGAPNPTFGLLTTTTTDPREIQFALKIAW